MDVLQAAWVAAGQPTPKAGVDGQCARCSAVGPVHRGGVKDNAAGFDGWAHPGRDRLCAACHWGRRTPELRAANWLVTSSPELRRVQRSDLPTLLAQPVPPDQAVAVVLRARRKHVLPAARWGHVAIDDLPARWRQREADLFATVGRLRELGASRTEMLLPAASWRLVQRTPPADWPWLQQAWENLRPWRSPDHPLMTVSLYATDHLRPA